MKYKKKRFGVYNVCSKQFQFGISKPTKKMALDALFEKIGNDAYKWRFEIKEIKPDSPRQEDPRANYRKGRKCSSH